MELWNGFIQALRDMNRENDGDICQELLPRISCPVLIIQGDKDAMVSGGHPQHLKDNLKNAKVEIFPDGKHNLHFKYKQKFNQLVEEFLLE